ncbi:MAG: helix-hairpin-helix domain-containing protein [Terracidiphilus sp.]
MPSRRQFLCSAVGAAFGLALPALAQTPPKSQLPPPEERADINHASVEELGRVPGMTRTWALRIVRFRPYHAKNDLLDRGVLPSEVYSRIKDYVIAHRNAQ